MEQTDKFFMNEAVLEAKKGLEEGGIPIGSILVVDGKIIGKGHNKRIQKSSVTLHGEMDCLENAGRLTNDVYSKATIYTTLSPCSMCSGAILLYKIKKVVIGENENFFGEEKLLIERGVQVLVLRDEECKKMMGQFISEKPKLWNEDIGV